MKRIRLLDLPDPRFDPGDPRYEPNRIRYRDVIERAIRSPLNPASGASIQEMREGLRVLDALDAAQDDVLELEDADWEHLKKKVDKLPWAQVDRRIVRFYDDVNQATATEKPSGGQGDGLGSLERLNGHPHDQAASVGSGEAPTTQ